MSTSASSSSLSPFKADVLKGRTCLVTGGGSGIGLEIATQMGLHGCNVAIMGRRLQVLQSAEKLLSSFGIPCLTIVGDVRSRDDAQSAASTVFTRFGSLDILINSAAGNFLAAAEDLSVNGFKTVIDIDAVGVFNMASACFPFLTKSTSSSIINISATLHKYAFWFQSHASAAKAAIDSLTRSMSLEWGEFGVRINGVAPGIIADTAGASKLGGDFDGSQMAIPMEQQVPLRRFGTKFDIAIACVFLASPAAGYISGHTLVVDGAAVNWRPQMINREMVRAFSKGIEKKSREVGVAEGKKGEQPKKNIKSRL